MHVQQRPGAGGTFAFGGTDVCPADGWEATYGTWSVDTVAANTDGSAGALKCVQDGTNAAWIKQTIYNIEQYRGKRVSVWGRAKGKNGHIILNDLDPSNNLVNFSNMRRDASAGWTTYGATITVAPTADRLQVWWVSDSASVAPFWLDNFCVTATDGPVPFQPLQSANLRILGASRYFKTKFSCRFRASAGGQIETYGFNAPLPLLGTLAGSITLTGTAGVDFSNITGPPVVTFDSTGAFRVGVTSAAGGDVWMFQQPLVIDAGVF
jgi:hypothetical protein